MVGLLAKLAPKTAEEEQAQLEAGVRTFKSGETDASPLSDEEGVVEEEQNQMVAAIRESNRTAAAQLSGGPGAVVGSTGSALTIGPATGTFSMAHLVPAAPPAPAALPL